MKVYQLETQGTMAGLSYSPGSLVPNAVPATLLFDSLAAAEQYLTSLAGQLPNALDNQQGVRIYVSHLGTMSIVEREVRTLIVSEQAADEAQEVSDESV